MIKDGLVSDLKASLGINDTKCIRKSLIALTSILFLFSFVSKEDILH